MLYHTNPADKRTEAVAKAFVKAHALAEAEGTKQVLLFVHQLANLDGHITDAFGETAVKELKKDHVITINGVTVYLETVKLRSAMNRGVALAPFVSPYLLEKIVRDPRFTDIVYTPWSPDELMAITQGQQSLAEI